MQLFLVRHADADFQADSDHQRPLNTLGLQQAALSAAFIKQQIQTNTAHILCSDAQRTVTTAEIIGQQLANCSITRNDLYYQASVGQWCDGISNHRSNEFLILVGHNPTMSLLAKRMNPQLARPFSPACVAHLELEIKADGLTLPAEYLNFFIPDAKQ